MKTVYYPTVHRFSSPTVSGSVCQPDVSFSISYEAIYVRLAGFNFNAYLFYPRSLDHKKASCTKLLHRHKLLHDWSYLPTTWLLPIVDRGSTTLPTARGLVLKLFE